LYSDATALLNVSSDYLVAVRSVADVQSKEAYLDMVQSQVNALPRSFAADNESTSLYAAWNYMNGQLPRVSGALQAFSTQVFSIFILILSRADR